MVFYFSLSDDLVQLGFMHCDGADNPAICSGVVRRAASGGVEAAFLKPVLRDKPTFRRDFKSGHGNCIFLKQMCV
jgi:hypothetical protein